MSRRREYAENNCPALDKIDVRLAKLERDLYWIKIIIISVFLPIQIAVLTLLLNMLHG